MNVDIKQNELKTNDSTMNMKEDVREITNMEETNNVITKDNPSTQEIDSIYAKLSVPYNSNVPLTNTPEKELVDNFFKSISCRR